MLELKVIHVSERHPKCLPEIISTCLCNEVIFVPSHNIIVILIQSVPIFCFETIQIELVRYTLILLKMFNLMVPSQKLIKMQGVFRGHHVFSAPLDQTCTLLSHPPNFLSYFARHKFGLTNCIPGWSAVLSARLIINTIIWQCNRRIMWRYLECWSRPMRGSFICRCGFVALLCVVAAPKC